MTWVSFCFIAELGVVEDLALLGCQSNQHAFLRAGRFFVLCSNFESFDNLLVEAILAGCPVVNTDCPSGPAEIMDHRQLGMLVPVEDAAPLSEANLAILAIEPDTEKLHQHERGSRAARQPQDRPQIPGACYYRTRVNWRIA